MLFCNDRIECFALKVALLFGLWVVPNAEASNFFSNCCPSASDWDCSIDVDYLYWKPCGNGLSYAAFNKGEEDSGNTALINIQSICPNWEPGYRIALGARPCCCAPFWLCGSFASLQSSQDDFVSAPLGDGILPTFTHPVYNQLITLFEGEFIEFESASAHWDTRYHHWDAGLHYRAVWNCCHEFIPFAGAGGLYFDETFNVIYAIEDNGELEAAETFTVANLKVSGAGLKLGILYRYHICKGFTVFTDVNGAVLVSDVKNTIKFGSAASDGSLPIPFPNMEFREKGCCTCIPGYHIGAGISYSGSICGITYRMKVGYEFLAWHHLPDYRLFVEGIDGIDESGNASNIAVSTVTYSRVLAYHGISAGIGLSF